LNAWIAQLKISRQREKKELWKNATWHSNPLVARKANSDSIDFRIFGGYWKGVRSIHTKRYVYTGREDMVNIRKFNES